MKKRTIKIPKEFFKPIPQEEVLKEFGVDKKVNYVQSGKMLSCGHCNPKDFFVPSNDGYVCECQCHKHDKRQQRKDTPVFSGVDKKQWRKERPLALGVLAYFPDALLEVAHTSYIGNKQHNDGQPLHWAREKSTDQLDAALRHITDHLKGEHIDDDGCYHLSKAAWRILAHLQLTLENERPS